MAAAASARVDACVLAVERVASVGVFGGPSYERVYMLSARCHKTRRPSPPLSAATYGCVEARVLASEVEKSQAPTS